MPRYQTALRLKHDGDVYEHGDVIELEAKVAKPLLADGTLVVEGSISKEKKSTGRELVDPKKETPEARAARAKENDKAKDKIETKKEPPKKDDETIKHIVTKKDLEDNPELAKQGLKVGDEIELSPEDDPGKDL